MSKQEYKLVARAMSDLSLFERVSSSIAIGVLTENDVAAHRTGERSHWLLTELNDRGYNDGDVVEAFMNMASGPVNTHRFNYYNWKSVMERANKQRSSKNVRY